MKSPLLSVTVMLSVLGVISCHGSFQTYNNEARQKVVDNGKVELNEIDLDLLKNVHKFNRPKEPYDPTWESLDTRPIPEWYDDNKIGIFIHWGVYSVPGLSDAWFWKSYHDGREDIKNFMEKNYKPGFTYQEFAPEFTAEFFDPDHWAKLFENAGARYVVLTSKHHDGFTLWPSKNAFSWNAIDVGPHRDLVADLATSVRNLTTMKFGLYHSLYEWYNPLYMNDVKNNLTTDEFVRFKTYPEMMDIVNTYHPEVIWSDGEWDAPSTYWKSQEFLAWLYNDSPVRETVVTNDRWGQETLCKHGGFFTCADRYNPGVLPPYKWENAMTLDRQSWAFDRNSTLENYLTPEELMTTIAETVACGGNILVNVGPTREGTIPPIQEERLNQMGAWLAVNGEAIYSTIPYTAQNDTVTPGVWYTTTPDKSHVYAMITKWPGSDIALGVVKLSSSDKVRLLGYEQELSWVEDSEGNVNIKMPRGDEINSDWVWTLDFSAN